MSQGIVFDFEWDPAKATSNLLKHGVTFDMAATIFLDPLTLTVFDAVHSQAEDRWLTIGIARSGELLVVAHTHAESGRQGVTIRVVSARAASRGERKAYEEGAR